MSDPLNTPIMLLKNSLNIKTPGTNSPGEKNRYIPRRLIQDSENDPPSSMISPSKYAMMRQLGSSGRLRLPLEDHDTNSQDSGISDDSKSCSEFRFAEPCGTAPRRMPSVDMSPRRLLASPLRSPRFTPPNSGSGGSMEFSRNVGTPDGSLKTRKTRLPDPSPKRSLSFSMDSAASLSSFTSEGTEDGFLDLFQNEKLMDEDAQMPGSRLGNLLSAQILTNSTPPRSPHRTPRFQSENISPNKNETFSLKRPLLPANHNLDTTPLSKRHKPLGTNQESNIVPPCERGTLFQYGFKRTLAAISNTGPLSPPHSITPPPHSPPNSPTTSSNHSIKLGFQRSATEELIGDFSRPYALPLLSAKENDLKIISCDTLAKLVKGEFEDKISSFKIIDCRYPYEFEGGHIKGALNLYRQDQITEVLQTRHRAKANAKAQLQADRIRRRTISQRTISQESDDGSFDSSEDAALNLSESVQDGLTQDSDGDFESQRHILVFHCEYSAERGPNLFRWLRKEDRAGNPYPQLIYPELYLLDGGYKAFFATHSDLCEPCSYTPMTDPAHLQDLKHFRAKSKSWAGKYHKKLSVRNLSRLGF